MDRQTASEIIARFNCAPGQYWECDSDGNVDVIATLNGIIDAIATTDYGDGTPTDEELAMIRQALFSTYIY